MLAVRTLEPVSSFWSSVPILREHRRIRDRFGIRLEASRTGENVLSPGFLILLPGNRSDLFKLNQALGAAKRKRSPKITAIPPIAPAAVLRTRSAI